MFKNSLLSIFNNVENPIERTFRFLYVPVKNAYALKYSHFYKICTVIFSSGILSRLRT